MNKIVMSDTALHTEWQTEWFLLNQIPVVHLKNNMDNDVYLTILQKKEIGRKHIIFLTPKYLLKLYKDMQRLGHSECQAFFKDITIVCGGTWTGTAHPWQGDLVYHVEKFFSEWESANVFFKKYHVTKIIFLADCIPSTKVKTIDIFEYRTFCMEFMQWGMPWLRHQLKHNVKRDKDFLCLIMRRDGRAHRDVLMQELENLKCMGDAIVKNNYRSHRGHRDVIEREDLVQSYGENIYQIEKTWFDRWPSTYLYQQTNFEVVGETFGEMGADAFFPTEKIIKPIVMCHPFLVAGSYRFLHHLRQWGFVTFGDFIDESYDEEPDMHKRMQMVAVEVKNICDRGSDKFYRATRLICEHNYNRLCDIEGHAKPDLWYNFGKLMEELS